jgi:hypothetical protein
MNQSIRLRFLEGRYPTAILRCCHRSTNLSQLGTVAAVVLYDKLRIGEMNSALSKSQMTTKPMAYV